MTNNNTAENVDTGTDSGTATAPDFNSFSASAPKELQELFTKNGVKDFDTLNKSYSGLNSMLGKKGLIKPAEGASEAEVKQYTEKLYEEIGVPKDGKYEYQIPESVPEEKVSKEFLEIISKKAAQNGVSQKAFADLITDIYTAYGEDIKSRIPDLEPLKKEWGKDADKNLQVAHAFYKNYMANDPDGESAAQRFGNDPGFLKFTYNMARKMGEDKLDASNSNSGLDAETVRKEAQALQKEALDLQKASDWQGAQTKQKEAKAKYEQYTQLTSR